MANENLQNLKAQLNNVRVIEVLRTDKQSEHWQTCIAYLKIFIGNRFPYLPQEMREDAAQEAAFLIYRNFSSFRGDSKFTTWMASIAFHFTIDMLRKQKGKNTWEVQIYDHGDEGKDVLSLIASRDDPVEYVLSQELRQEFRAALEEFLRKRRKAKRDREILAKILQGHSYQEIADEYGIQSTVVSAVFYSFRKFWSEQHCGGMPNK